MSKVRVALWLVVVAGILFWAIIGMRSSYLVADMGGPVALWATSIVIIIVLLSLAGSEINQQWLGILIDTRNKLSLARLQVALWTIMVMSAYLVIALTRIEAMQTEALTQNEALNITFPPELLLAMGISAASFAGSTLIKQAKRTRTLTIGAKSTPESAEEERDGAKEAFDAADAELLKKAQAEVDAKAELDRAADAVQAAAAGPAKEDAERRKEMAQAFHANALREKKEATKHREERKDELETAERHLAAIMEAQGRLHRNASPSEASWVDLFRGEEISNYRLVDMSKVQMMFFTVVVIAVYAAGIITLLEGNLLDKDGLSFPPFGDTLNVLLGISHGTYLSVKSVDHS